MKLRNLLLMLLVLVLSACGRGQSDLRSRIDEVKRRPGDPIEPLPTIVTLPSFEYVAQEERDPFGSAGGDDPIDVPTGIDVAVLPEGPKPIPGRRREPLEDFELDSLAMVGTFYIEEQLYGLVADPSGLLYRVKPGEYAGRNHGKITSVFNNKIELIELIPNGDQAWLEQEAALALDEE